MPQKTTANNGSANEPLSDDVQLTTDLNTPMYDLDSGNEGNAIPDEKPTGAGAAAVAEVGTLDSRSEGGGSDNLQWGYKPRSRFTETMNRLVPHGGAISNIYSMCSVTLGSGIFSLPYAFKSSGIAVAVVVLVAISLATVYSVYIMVQAVEKTRELAKQELANRQNLGAGADKAEAASETALGGGGQTEDAAKAGDEVAEEKKGTFGSLKRLNEQGASVSTLFLCSYESLSRGLLGPFWAYLAAFCMWMFCFGSCVSYVITVNDLIATALKPNPGDAPKSGFLFENEWGSKVLTVAVWAVLMLPLSLPKQINSLRYVSVLGVTFIMYFVVVLIVHSCQNSFYKADSGAVTLKNTLSAAKSGNEALSGFSMFLFAFLVQTNVLQLHKESTKPTPGRITRDCGIATTICTTLYILAGFFGYAEFGEVLEGTILREYNVRSEPAVAVGFVLLGFKLCVSFAICMQPSRDSVYYCMRTDARTIRTTFHVAIVVFMSIVALILGLVIPDVEIVFSLVGSLAGGFLGFVFPALFIMYAGNWSLRSVGFVHWTCTYLLLVAGVVAIVFGTCTSIFSMI